MLALVIVEAEPSANAGLGLGDRRIGIEVDFLVFEAPPQSLDEDVVHAAPLAIHADRYLVALQGAGEVVAGELAALVGIEDLGPAVVRECFLARLDFSLWRYVETGLVPDGAVMAKTTPHTAAAT
jgi:hypothetical protein